MRLRQLRQFRIDPRQRAFLLGLIWTAQDHFAAADMVAVPSNCGFSRARANERSNSLLSGKHNDHQRQCIAHQDT
jgi:hypothetical protein